MTPTRWIAAPLVLSAVLAGTAACGSAKDGGNSAACKKLEADVNALDSSSSNVSTPSQLESTFGDAASKLTSDASSGDAALKSAVKQLTDEFDQLVSDAKSGNSSAVTADESKLENIGSQLDKACPEEASDTSS